MEKDLKKRPRAAVIDYGMGNLRSVLRAFETAGANAYLVSAPQEAKGADALIFPGQGAIVDTMVLLKRTGFDRLICDWICADKPFFGICLGMQALFEFSQEGDTPALGVFKGRVNRFRLPPNFKIPHMGWNRVCFKNAEGDPLLEGISPCADFYFVHSYYVETPDSGLVWATTDYAAPFTSAIRRGRCFATQFHPEKSQEKGLRLYRNFLRTL